MQWWSCMLKCQPVAAEVEAAGRATAAEVGAACRSIGFMVLYTTGIPDGLRRGNGSSERFFAALAEHKQTASNAGSRCYRGY